MIESLKNQMGDGEGRRQEVKVRDLGGKGSRLSVVQREVRPAVPVAIREQSGVLCFHSR